jgi:hypothetical protein
MQKCFMSKVYLRETTLFLQGCTIFSVFVTAHLLCAFKELNISKSIPNYKLESKTKSFDDEKFALLVKFNMADL